jgi:hypothetical protein
MAYKRPTTMYDAMMSGLDSLGKVADTINETKRTQSALKSADLANQEKEQKVAQEKLTTAQAQEKSMLEDSFHKAQDDRMNIPVGVRSETPTDAEMKLWARIQEKPIEEVRAGLQRTQGEAQQVGLENDTRKQNLDFNKNLMPLQLQGEKLRNVKTQADMDNGKYTPTTIMVDGEPQVAGFSGKDATVKRSGEEAPPKLVNGKTAGQKRDEEVFKAKDKLREAYEKTGVANAITMLNDVSGKIGGVDGQGDIAGYGSTGLTPQFLLTPAGKEIRTSLAGLRNIILKDRSGAAVSNQEFDRLKDEIGGGTFSTDADLRSKLKRMGEIVAQHARNIDATFDGDPEVPKTAFEQYRQAGGITGSSLNLNPAAALAAMSPEKKALAQQALNDPEATAADKAQARKILGL